MSRLTQRNEQNTSYYYPECIEGCHGEGCSEECNNCPVETSIIEKLGSYEDAEEQGLLLRLPCKVGDTVFFVGNVFVGDYIVKQFIITEHGIDAIRVSKEIDGKEYWNAFYLENWLVSVFPTKEEAEQKLESMQKGE